MKLIFTKPYWTWIIAAVALIGLFTSTLLAKSGVLVLGEEHVLGFIYNWPDNLRLPFLILTLLGSIWILAVILIILLIQEKYEIAKRVIIAGLAAGLISNYAKIFVARPRPVLLTEIFQRELFVLGYGFPSGHVALATAIALTIGFYFPHKYRFIPALWILIVAISRLYLGVHAPLDIVGGFCIGLLVAISVRVAIPDGKKLPRIRVAKKHKQG